MRGVAVIMSRTAASAGVACPLSAATSKRYAQVAFI
jgi:hypothetical protein